MRFWIDCEFNGFGGELISVALVDENDRQFYWILMGRSQKPTEWVAEHVEPVLDTEKFRCQFGSVRQVRDALQAFLCVYNTCHVIADWPEDIVHFCKLILTDRPGERINTPPLTMEIVRIDSESELPHNALADAIGIKKTYLEQ